MGKIIGIDLGTTNSAAAVVMGGKPVIIPSAEGATIGGKMFPSVVAFTKDGQVLVGEPARRQAATNPERTIVAIKRKMGTNYKVVIDKKTYTPQEISALILQKIKKDAEAFLGEKVEKAVITVPAYFNDNQRTATKDAGKIAGLDVVRIINEPTAAALAYGLTSEKKELKIAVLDLGGGTFDVTIMEMGEGVFEVLSTSGDTQLGGTDMDNAIVEWIVSEFKSREGIDLKKDKSAMIRVREAAEKAKIELSTVMETTINLPYITATNEGPKHLEMKLTRAKMEQIIAPILERLKPPIKTALSDAKLKPEDIAKVILVGGPTRMPCVQKIFEEAFGKKPERSIDPMECVAQGAAIQGSILAGETKDILLLDVTPLSLGVETLGGVFTKIIERNTTIPVKRSQVFTTAADGQTVVDIHVLQGERAMAKDNVSLGRFSLVGIPPAPRGIPQIEVTFDIDANGILNVTAKDLGTGKEQKIVITASTKLSKEEIDEAMRKAQEFAEKDRQMRELAELKNNADALIYQAEKLIAESGEKFGSSAVQEIKNEIESLRSAMGKDDASEINAAMERLKKKLYEAGTEIYKRAGTRVQPETESGASGSESTGKSKEPGGEKVVDAEYEVVDEDKEKKE